ncbi:uncharacterized protein LOC129295944 [Prosopis cineraria]|uniref:uncharacterized protein LOC129295944 n=1 Tax=Prosopis cineraria TaxID=364024 RepID=UPI0024109FD5|nr:uncharacterized protein LOC129295944 [Prosopis cineraria]
MLFSPSPVWLKVLFFPWLCMFCRKLELLGARRYYCQTEVHCLKLALSGTVKSLFGPETLAFMKRHASFTRFQFLLGPCSANSCFKLGCSNLNKGSRINILMSSKVKDSGGGGIGASGISSFWFASPSSNLAHRLNTFIVDGSLGSEKTFFKYLFAGNNV